GANRAGAMARADVHRARRPRRDHDQRAGERLWPPEEGARRGRLGRLFLLLLLALERELASREDATHLEVEVVRVGGGLTRGLVGDDAGPIESEQALVERLHPVLGRPRGDDRGALGRWVGL